MKCTKCKYTTFDYVDTCPRCGKDISGEKARLNILSVKPNTPFLLGSLTGDLNDSGASFVVPEASIDASESMKLDAGEVYDDGSDLSIDIEEEAVEESEKEADAGDISLTDAEKELELDFEPEDTGSELNLEDEDQEQASDSEPPKEEESGELELDTGDLDLQLEFDEGEDSDK
jgi:hypothetical protein